VNTEKDQHRSPARRELSGYEVGYGRPPHTFRFKKGVSGNPKGRPPGRRYLEALRAMIDEAVSKIEHGKAEFQMSKPAAMKISRRRGSRSVEFSDEELLRMVKDRKISWLALIHLYFDESRRNG
jgi:hypothetical protein